MNRRQALGRLAALFGAGVAAPAVLAAEPAREHLAAAKAWGVLASVAGGIHVYIDPLNPASTAYQRNVAEAIRFADERYGRGRITVRKAV